MDSGTASPQEEGHRAVDSQGTVDLPLPADCPYCGQALQVSEKANGTVELRCVKPTAEGMMRAHGVNMYVKARK